MISTRVFFENLSVVCLTGLILRYEIQKYQIFIKFLIECMACQEKGRENRIKTEKITLTGVKVGNNSLLALLVMATFKLCMEGDFRAMV